jgi:hypothetical protein
MKRLLIFPNVVENHIGTHLLNNNFKIFNTIIPEFYNYNYLYQYKDLIERFIQNRIIYRSNRKFYISSLTDSQITTTYYISTDYMLYDASNNKLLAIKTIDISSLLLHANHYKDTDSRSLWEANVNKGNNFNELWFNKDLFNKDNAIYKSLAKTIIKNINSNKINNIILNKSNDVMNKFLSKPKFNTNLPFNELLTNIVELSNNYNEVKNNIINEEC